MELEKLGFQTEFDSGLNGWRVAVIGDYYYHRGEGTISSIIDEVSSVFPGLSYIQFAQNGRKTSEIMMSLVMEAVSNTVILWNSISGDGELTRQGDRPFGGFVIEKQNGQTILGVGNVNGFTLSLLKRHGLIRSFDVLTIWKAVEVMRKAGAIRTEEATAISFSRGADFCFPVYAAAYLLKGGELPSRSGSLAKIPDYSG